MGFTSSHVLTAQLAVQGHLQYDLLAAVNQFYNGVFAELRATPGVEAVGAVSGLPLISGSTCGLMVERHPVPLDQLPGVRCIGTRGQYFETLRVPLVRGCMFNESDLPGHPISVLITEAMARATSGLARTPSANACASPNPWYRMSPTTPTTVSCWRRGLGPGAHELADGVLAGPEVAGHGLIDEDRDSGGPGGRIH